MPNGDPQDGFFYPTLTLMIDSYNFEFIVCVYLFLAAIITWTDFYDSDSPVITYNADDDFWWWRDFPRRGWVWTPFPQPPLDPRMYAGKFQ